MIANTMPPIGFSYVPNSAIVYLDTGSAYPRNPTVVGQTLTWRLNDIVANYQLPPGRSVQIVFDMQTSAGAVGGTNTVRVDYTTCTAPIIPYTNTATKYIDIYNYSADLSISAAVDKPRPLEWETVTFTITLANAGPGSAHNVKVRAPLPFGLDFVSATATHGTYDNVTGLWSIDVVPSGQSAQLQISAVLFKAATLSLTAEVMEVLECDPDSDPGNGAVTEDDYAFVKIIGYKTFSAGSCIVNPNAQPTTMPAGVKLYGMLYDLIINYKVPVYWSIACETCPPPAPGQFIIPAEYKSGIAARLAYWQAQGVVLDCTTPTPITVPVYSDLTSFPNAALDLDNGHIAREYYINAGIPGTSYAVKTPSQLNPCDDVYIMPHADPHQDWTLADKQAFIDFIKSGGALWGACHAVSALEGPTAEGYLGLYLLSNAGLVPWRDHGDGVPPYTYRPTASCCDPIMQFKGDLTDSTTNGSEQIYVPIAGWRPTTTVAVWDPDFPPGRRPPGTYGEAAVVAYGRAYGNPNYGMVMYEAGHNHDQGTAASRIAAQSAFFNFVLLAGVDRRPEIRTSIPSTVNSGETVTVAAEVVGGTSPYTYSWSSDCGGVFVNPSAATTTFTAPYVDRETICIIRVSIRDACNRNNFAATAVKVLPGVPALGLVKTGVLDMTVVPPADRADPGDKIHYTFTVTNTGNVTLRNVRVSDARLGITDLAVSPSTLAPGQQGTARFSYTLTQADIDAGGVTNQALAAGTDPQGRTVTDRSDESSPYEDDPTAVAVGQVPDLSLTKVPNPTSFTAFGEVIEYTITVVNTGNVTLTEILVTDPKLGLEQTVPALSPGESISIVVLYRITQDDLEAERVKNTVTASTLFQGVPIMRTAEATVVGPPPVIGVAKRVDSVECRLDGTCVVTYSLVVQNYGPMRLLNVQVTDDLSVTFAQALAFQVIAVSAVGLTPSATYNGRPPSIALLSGTDVLEVGAKGLITVTVQVMPGGFPGPYLNQAVAVGVSPAGTTTVDRSQNGANPDPDGDGVPQNNNEPTPLIFPFCWTAQATAERVWFQTDIAMYASSEFEMFARLELSRWLRPEGIWLDVVEREALAYAFSNLIQVELTSRVGLPLEIGPRVQNLARLLDITPRDAGERALAHYAQRAGLRGEDRPTTERWVFAEYAGGEPVYATRRDTYWPGGDWRAYEMRITPSSLGMSLVHQVVQARRLGQSATPICRYISHVLMELMVNKILLLEELAVVLPHSGIRYFARAYEPRVDPESGRLQYVVVEEISTLFDLLALFWGLTEFIRYYDPDRHDLFGWTTQPLFGRAVQERARSLALDILRAITSIHRDPDGALRDVYEPRTGLRRGSSTVNLGLLLVALVRAEGVVPADLLVPLRDEVGTKLLEREIEGGYRTDLEAKGAPAIWDLDAQLAAIRGLLAIYNLTRDAKYLASAERTFKHMEKLLWKPNLEVYARKVAADGTPLSFCYTPLDVGLAVGALRELALSTKSLQPELILERMGRFFVRILDEAGMQLSNAGVGPVDWLRLSPLFLWNGLSATSPLAVDAPLGVAPVLQKELCFRYGATPGRCSEIPLDTRGAVKLTGPCGAPER
ncbi:MAG: hypothetical protein ABDI20_04120 [Candidatus Bipolaricaulaceae bacterium]